jgi:hypothetical protein
MRSIVVVGALALMPAVAEAQVTAFVRHNDDVRAYSGVDDTNVETTGPRLGNRVVAHADLVARLEPAGGAVMVGAFNRYTFGMFDSTTESSYLQGGLSLMASLGHIEPQAHVEYLALPWLKLRLDAAALRFLGTNRSLLRFESKSAAYDDAALDARSADERAAWAGRFRATVGTRTIMGPFLAIGSTSVALYRFDDPGPYVYEPDNDMLMNTSDWLITNRFDCLYMAYRSKAGTGLLFGPTLEWRAPFRDQERNRLGLSAFVPVEQWGLSRRMRLYASAGVNLRDPERSGKVYGALGVGADLE